MKLLKGPSGYYARRMAEKKGNAVVAALKGNKGEKGGSCNRTACQMPASQDHDGIRWFNHSTRKYYCASCAWDLKEDRFNKADAIQIWGHDLCTLED